MKINSWGSAMENQTRRSPRHDASRRSPLLHTRLSSNLKRARGQRPSRFHENGGPASAGFFVATSATSQSEAFHTPRSLEASLVSTVGARCEYGLGSEWETVQRPMCAGRTTCDNIVTNRTRSWTQRSPEMAVHDMLIRIQVPSSLLGWVTNTAAREGMTASAWIRNVLRRAWKTRRKESQKSAQTSARGAVKNPVGIGGTVRFCPYKIGA